MSDWPESHDDRLSTVLLRVDLSEGRFLAEGQYNHVVNHLLRSAAAACLLDREADAVALIARAGARLGEWIDSVEATRTKPTSFVDYACTRGMLALALWPDPAGERIARRFLTATAELGPGSQQNARMAAALYLGESADVARALAGAERSDPGLGQPWMRFVAALEAKDAAACAKAATMWLREKMEATFTNEWGAYNEIPIEVSAALALAERRGVSVRLPSNRILPRFRA